MRGKRWVVGAMPALLVLALAGTAVRMHAAAQSPAQSQVTSPEKFFGFRMGTDRKIARWDKIVDYYNLLQKQSPRIKVTNMGPSTEGNPFLLVIISHPPTSRSSNGSAR